MLDYVAEATCGGREVSRQLLGQAMEAGVIRRVDPDALLALLGVALPALASSKNCRVRSVWEDKELGSFSGGFAAEVNGSAALFAIVSGCD